MGNWSKLLTEQRNPASENLDEVSTLEMLAIINREDTLVPKAVAQQLAPIAQAIDLISQQIAKGGRLFYLGAGTSGRLGVLDASECPPTFSVSPDIIQGLIAGGSSAVAAASSDIRDRVETTTCWSWVVALETSAAGSSGARPASISISLMRSICFNGI